MSRAAPKQGETVLIAGAGIAGLTAALCAHRAGLVPRLFDRAPDLTEVGAGLQLGPNAMKIMRALGLSDAIMAAGYAPRRLDLRDGANGSIFFSVPAGTDGPARWGAPHIAIRRPALQAVLRKAVETRCPGALHLAAEAVDFRPSPEGPVLTLADGTERQGSALIAADGIHSALRSRLLQGERPNFTGNLAWRAVVPADETLRALLPDAAAAWAGPGRHAVTYFLDGGATVNFVGVVERDEPAPETWDTLGDPEQARQDFAGFCEPVRAVLERARTVGLWGLYDRPTPDRLQEGRTALIGDAACPMPPFMAQGAALAMEAAWTAVWSLTSTGDFRRYERALKPRASRLLDAARRNGDLFHGRGLPTLWKYAPVRLTSRVIPSVILARFDWVYGVDPTRDRPLMANRPGASAD